MITYKYNSACRNCLKAVETPKVFFDTSMQSSKANNLTEFESLKVIKNLIGEDATCPFCNSSNIQIEDVFINDTALYDFDKLSIQYPQTNYSGVYEIYITKLEDDTTTYRTNVDKLKNRYFLRSALLEALYTISDIPDAEFKSIYGKARLYMVLAGEITHDGDLLYTHRLSFVGFDKQTIQLCIFTIAKENKIDLSNLDGNIEERVEKKTIQDVFNEMKLVTPKREFDNDNSDVLAF